MLENLSKYHASIGNSLFPTAKNRFTRLIRTFSLKCSDSPFTD